MVIERLHRPAAGGDPLGHRHPRAIDDEVCERIDVGGADLGEQLAEPPRRGFVRGDQGIDVALDLMRQSRICLDDREQRLVHATGVDQLHDRHGDAFGEEVGAVGRQTDAAHVGHVARAGEQRDQAVGPERGGNHHIIVEMAGPVHGSLVTKTSPGAIVAPESVRENSRRSAPSCDGPGSRSPPAPASARADRTRRPKGPGFAHDRTERSAQQRLRLFLDQRDEACPHHLQPHGRYCAAIAHATRLSVTSRSRIRCERASIVTVNVRVATVVVSSSMTSAGPGTRAPGWKSPRS